MSVIVKASYETASKYANGRVVTKVNNKKHQVYFRVPCDDYSLNACIELAKNSSNVLMLDYEGLPMSPSFMALTEPTGVYIGIKIEVGMDLSEDDIVRIINDIPAGVIPIIKLPDEYKNIRFVYNMSQKYDRIRFCGGTMFNISGCRLGCCGADILDKNNIKFPADSMIHNGCSCGLEVVDEEGLEFEVSQKAVRQSRAPKTPREKSNSTAPKKKAVSNFMSLFSGDLEEL